MGSEGRPRNLRVLEGGGEPPVLSETALRLHDVLGRLTPEQFKDACNVLVQMGLPYDGEDLHGAIRELIGHDPIRRPRSIT